MAGDWIKLELTTPDKPEIHRMSETLSISVEQVLGGMVRVWIWADTQSIDGNAISVTETSLDRIGCVAGLARAMKEVGWLKGSNGKLSIPNFDRHNGKTAKSRALTAKRAVTHRQRNSNAATVTLPLPEKRREEKEKTYAFALPPWVPEENWKAWLEVRSKNRAPNTPRALQLAVKELDRLRGLGQDPATLLDKATLNGWRAIWPLKDQPAPVTVDL